MSSFDDRIKLPDSLDGSCVSGYHIIYGKQITPDNIREALDIDFMCYDDIYHLEWQQCVDYHKRNPYIYIMAVDVSGKIVGYINFSPVTEKIYEIMRSGKSVDTIISSDDILEYREGETYSMYLSSICVHPKYQGKGIAKLLLSNLKELIRCVEDNEIVIKRIVADAVTEAGERILTSMGFEVVCLSEHGSKIMEDKRGG